MHADEMGSGAASHSDDTIQPQDIKYQTPQEDCSDSHIDCSEILVFRQDEKGEVVNTGKIAE